jgi:hypothetical protein
MKFQHYVEGVHEKPPFPEQELKLQLRFTLLKIFNLQTPPSPRQKNRLLLLRRHFSGLLKEVSRRKFEICSDYLIGLNLRKFLPILIH